MVDGIGAMLITDGEGVALFSGGFALIALIWLYYLSRRLKRLGRAAHKLEMAGNDELGISWGRGFFRLWLVGSTVWIGFVAWLAYQTKDHPTLTNRCVCLPDATYAVSDYLFPQTVSTFTFLLLALTPVISAWIAGLVLAWIAAGFWRSR
jgi:hypothetical protein